MPLSRLYIITITKIGKKCIAQRPHYPGFFLGSVFFFYGNIVMRTCMRVYAVSVFAVLLGVNGNIDSQRSTSAAVRCSEHNHAVCRKQRSQLPASVASRTQDSHQLRCTLGCTSLLKTRDNSSYSKI